MINISLVLKNKKRYFNLFFVLPLILTTLTLLPYCFSGFFFDDILNSLYHGAWYAYNISPWDSAIKGTKQWMFEAGRFFPFATFSGPFLWSFQNTLFTYRVVHLSFVISNIFITYKLISTISKSKLIPWLFLIALPMTFQFNPRWDPITSFGPLNQMCFLFVGLSWLFTLQYLKSKQLYFLVLVFLFEILALLTYEVGILSWLGILVISFYMNRDKKKDFPYSLIIGSTLILVLYLAISWHLKKIAVSGYSGISISFNNIAPTFIAQFTSAFPLSFLNNKVIPGVFDATLFVFLFAIFFFLFSKFVANNNNFLFGDEDKNKSLLYVLSFILLIFPSILISLSERYQQVVSYGDPQLIIYFEYIGASILLSLLLNHLIKSSKTYYFKFFVLICIVPFVISLTIASNFKRIHIKNKGFHYPRAQTEFLIANDFLKQISEGDVLLSDSLYPWEAQDSETCSAFFSLHAKRKINCIPIHLFKDKMFSQAILSDRKIFIFEHKTEYKNGIIKLNGAESSYIAFFNNKGRFVNIVKNPASGFYPSFFLDDGFYGWEPLGESKAGS
jgi:hypothetical protein